VARAGLDVPFEVTVHRDGGFDGDVVLALSNDHLALFDRNAMDPEPDSATSDPDATTWTFDQPPGDTFTLSIDMQVQASRHWGREGRIQLLDPSGSPIVQATFRTWLAPERSACTSSCARRHLRVRRSCGGGRRGRRPRSSAT
jgi:hypothetical protein